MNKKQRQTLQKIFEKPERSDISWNDIERLKSMMEYKGYFAKIEFDDGANIFHGEVINLRDVITFEGETVKELKQAFQDSIDDYLDLARKEGKSLNVWVSDAISKTLKDITAQGHSL
jgi:predicted HicB family RNase H-like nuclease